MNKEQLRAIMLGGKHHAVAKAWAQSDDAVLQYLTMVGGWCDKSPSTDIFVELEYRIKPKTLRYRVALMSNGLGFATNDYGVTAHITSANFVKWLGDWQEVEVDHA